jgi:hypothetical protein
VQTLGWIVCTPFKVNRELGFKTGWKAGDGRDLLKFGEVAELPEAAERQEIVGHGYLIGKYRINLDGEWLFEDFSEFPHL